MWALSESVHENQKLKVLWDSELQTGHPVTSKIPDLVSMNKKKINCRLTDFAVQDDYRVKIKESEEIDKLLDIARELKKL